MAYIIEEYFEKERFKVMKTKVFLETVERVKEFVDITTSIDADMDLSSGRYVIDAKSIMGVLSLNLAKPIDFELHSSNEKLIAVTREKLQGFICNV